MLGTYKTVQKTIELDSFTPITIWFFGDVHRDTRACDVNRWKWFLDRAKKCPKETTYYIGMGDMHDFASTREKKTIENELHETTIEKFDYIAERENRAFMREIGFMRGHTLGLIEGNHYWKFQDGTTTTEDLAKRLDTEYLGWLCHYSLTFKFGAGKSATVHLVLCHGRRAGGKTMGITVNQVDDLCRIFPIADIYVQGHDHQRFARPKSVLYPTHGGGTYSLKQKRQFLCRSGSFKKAYLENEMTYESKMLFQPSDLGALRLDIGFHRDREGGTDRLITDIEATI